MNPIAQDQEGQPISRCSGAHIAQAEDGVVVLLQHHLLDTLLQVVATIGTRRNLPVAEKLDTQYLVCVQWRATGAFMNRPVILLTFFGLNIGLAGTKSDR